jgi:hypothetical protein
VVAERLALPHDDVGTLAAGRLQQPGAQGVECGDQLGPNGAGQLGGGRQVLDDAEEVRLGQQQRGGLVARLAAGLLQVGRAVQGADLDELEVEPGRVGVQQLPHPGGDGRADQDLVTAGGGGDHGGRLGDRARPVVQRGVGDLQPGQLTDERLVLEQDLEHALAHLGLVRGVAGGVLAPPGQVPHGRGDVVVVDPGAEEADQVVQVAVAGGEAAQLGRDLLLGVRAGQVQLGGGAQPGRDRREQLLDVAQAEVGKHPLDVGVGMGLVGHRLPLRAAGSMGPH